MVIAFSSYPWWFGLRHRSLGRQPCERCRNHGIAAVRPGHDNNGRPGRMRAALRRLRVRDADRIQARGGKGCGCCQTLLPFGSIGRGRDIEGYTRALLIDQEKPAVLVETLRTEHKRSVVWRFFEHDELW